MNPAVAVPVLVRAVGKAKGTLYTKTVQAARQIVLAALRDRDEGVRGFTGNALGKFGGSDMIPALKEVAASDPSPEVEGHSIRKSAAEAIAEIQQRAGQH